MLQLVLLRVITWPGSRFKKQRIKAQNLFVPTRSSWCSSILNSANRALDLVWVFVLIYQWWFGYWKFILNRHSFLLRVCRDLFLFDFIIPVFFAWTVSFVITVSGMPQFFVSLLHRFWLIGLCFFFWKITTVCLDDCMEPSPSLVSEGLLWCHFVHLDHWVMLPCPRLWLRVLICEKKNSNFFGSKGLTRDYLPYNSTV